MAQGWATKHELAQTAEALIAWGEAPGAMASRSADWLRQGRRDLDHARRAREDGDHEWACFAAHQAAETALTAVFQGRGEEAWGHALSDLVGALARDPASDPLVTRAKALDKHYIPARYPNGFATGAPMDDDTTDDATRAIDDAEAQAGLANLAAALSGSTPPAPHEFRATGQATCWNSGGAAIPCAGTGQDGDIPAGAPQSDRDKGDGTITDNRTVHVAGLNAGTGFAGHRDRRLPDVTGLQSTANCDITSGHVRAARGGL